MWTDRVWCVLTGSDAFWLGLMCSVLVWCVLTYSDVRTHQNWLEHIRLGHNTSEQVRTHQNRSEHIRAGQNTSEQGRTHQNRKEHRRKSQNWLEQVSSKVLHKVVLHLLQPVQAVLAIQVHRMPLEIVSNDFPYPKTYGLRKTRSIACSETKILLEVLLDLLQPIQAVLAILVHLRPLEIVSNDSPYPKT